MEFSTFLWTTFAAFVTLATFSFLYKDNPFYKFAEHLVVGVSAGYFVVILWHNGLMPNLVNRLTDGDWYFFWLNSARWYYVIPAVLGLMMWTRFSTKIGWLSRWPMALYIGISTGVVIPAEMSNRVNKQLFAMMVKIKWDTMSEFLGTGPDGGINILDPTSGLSQVIIFVGSISGLVYFFFSLPHSGAVGRVAKLGLWTLMIGFGASFGFTVMARVSLFINRMQDLRDWGVAAFDAAVEPNANYHSGFQTVFWLFVAAVVAYILYELVTSRQRRTNSAA